MSRVFFGCQAVAPHMEKQRSGRIIKFSSQAGKTGGLLIGARSRRGQSSRRQYFQAAIAGGLRQPGIVDDHPGDRFQRQR